jgi:hypothetical protein
VASDGIIFTLMSAVLGMVEKLLELEGELDRRKREGEGGREGRDLREEGGRGREGR